MSCRIGQANHIRGAYSSSGPSKFRHQLGKTERNILFAGEHTSSNEYSLVHGAAKEGRRAAMEAMQNQA
jgi:monoamine oxidase